MKLEETRTIADLADSEDIKPEHLPEAIQYRSLDREMGRVVVNATHLHKKHSRFYISFY